MVKFRHILHHHFCFGAIQYGLPLAPLCCGPFMAILFSPILTPGQQYTTFLHTFRGGIGGRQNCSYCPNPINSILFPHQRSKNCKFFTHLSKKNRKVCEQVEYAHLRSAIRNFFTSLQKERSAILRALTTNFLCFPWHFLLVNMLLLLMLLHIHPTFIYFSTHLSKQRNSVQAHFAACDNQFCNSTYNLQVAYILLNHEI